MIRYVTCMIWAASMVSAETIVATRTIPAHTVLTFNDLTLSNVINEMGTDNPLDLVGKESRSALFAGRPIRLSDVSSPAIIERNDLVPLVFKMGALSIRTEGRALERGGVGDVILVMNLSSRSTVTAKLGSDGAAYVGP